MDWNRVGAKLGVLALLAGTAAGCGAKDEPTTAGGGGAAPANELAAVDPADPSAYVGWLKANGVEAPEVSLSTHRGGGASEVAAWPLLPRGEVRLEGLTVWRIEVDDLAFEPEAGGVLEFRKGKSVLYRDTAPFVPGSRIVQGGLPKSVLDAVKVGDTITWGVVVEGKPKASAVAEFKIVNKPSAAKQIDRIENDRRNARQSAKVKSLARNQILLNTSLFAEALRGYMDLAVGEANDPIVMDACYRIVECLRRLDLGESPLYGDALALAASYKGKSGAKAAPSPGVGEPVEKGLPITGEYVSSARTGIVEAKPTEPKPTEPTPPAPDGEKRNAPSDANTRRAVAAAEALAETAQKRASDAEAQARGRAGEAQGSEAALAAARAAAEKAKGTAGEAEAAAALAQAEQASSAARLEQDKAHALWERAQGNAKMLEDFKRFFGQGEKQPPTEAERQAKVDGVASWVAGLVAEADALRASAEALDQAAKDAQSKAESSGDADDVARALELRTEANQAFQDAATKKQEAGAAKEQLAALIESLRPAPEGAVK